MELRHLRYFVVVAEEQNVTRAAARLHVSQPPLSRAIRQLESNLGVDLFTRDAKSLRLTEAGKFFLNEARAVLVRADEAAAAVRRLAKGAGALHVGYAPSLAVDILPGAMKAFHHRFPDTRVHLHDLSTEEMVAGLCSGVIQVALLVNPSGKMSAKIRFEPIREFAACAALPPEHPLAGRSGVALRELSGEKFVAYSSAEYPEYHRWLAELFPKTRPPVIVGEYDSSNSLIAAVQSGRGVALVQDGFGKLAGPRLRILPIVPEAPRFVFGVARRKGVDEPVTEAFVTAVKSGVPAAPPTGSPVAARGAKKLKAGRAGL